jgi:hypothetical protein
MMSGVSAESRASSPVLRTVPDVQDFHNFFGETVNNDVGAG